MNLTGPPAETGTDWVLIDALTGADYNPRKITPKAMEKLKHSLRDFGMPQPIIVNRTTGNIVGGHQRWAAAKALEWERVPVTYVEIGADEERALNVALNNAELTGEFDMEKLAELLSGITDDGIREATGFDLDQIDGIINRYLEQPEEPEPPVYPLSPRFLESYDYVIVMTTNKSDWMHLHAILGLEHESNYKNSYVGVGKVLTFDRFRQVWEKHAPIVYPDPLKLHHFRRPFEKEGEEVCGLCAKAEDDPIHERIDE